MKKEKHNKYADKVAVHATLDFHGQGVLTKAMVERQVSSFLERSRVSGHRLVLIITGKGLHSDQGPKVKVWVEECLGKSDGIERYKEARRDRGGSGAYEILL